MKNAIAILSGIIASFLIYFVIMLILMKLNYGGFGEFATGTLNEGQTFQISERSILIENWILLPISVMIAAIISALIVDAKEYLFGLLCAIPITVYSIHTGTYYQSVLLVMSFLGVGVVKFIKGKIKNTGA